MYKWEIGIMQRIKTIALFSAIVFSAGILGAYGFSSVSSTLKAQSDMQTAGSVPLLGHVTLTVRDPEGNVVAYHQGDNTVVTAAENCLSDRIFGIPIASCPTGGTNPYNVIGIGNGSGTASRTDTGLIAEENGDISLRRATATVQTGTAAGASPVSDVLQVQFTNAGSTNTVTEAGIFNSTTYNAPGMFAHQTFTGITLNTGDSLTVKWTIATGP